MLVAGNYGYFRDELYYIEAGRHLSFGFVDFPPLVALLAALLRVLAGDSLVAIHVVPAIADGLVVLLTGLLARGLGGRRFAQALAATASLAAVAFMAFGSIFSMDSLDALWWVLASYVVVRVLKENRPRLWVLFGLVAGVGLATKLTMLFFGFALTVGILLTPARRHFRSGWIWLGATISFLFLLPYALWNLANGWPTLLFFADYGGAGNGPIYFLSGQVSVMNPLTMPLSFAGMWFYFATSDGKPYRSLGWAFVVLLALFALLGAKPYYFAAAYPMLFAGGSLVVERLGARAWRTLRPAYVTLLVLSGLLLAPVAMPVLPPAAFARTYGSSSGAGDASAGQGARSGFPQNLADRFGWEAMTRTVARAYHGLPAKQRSQACVFTSNYGEASAVNVLGRNYGLPPAISGHNSYWLWGPGRCGGKTLITVGVGREDLERGYASMERVATIRCRYCMEFEDNLPVYVVTEPKAPIREFWPEARHYD
jgi:4-amino-4-deoxy-L-arabinose transferase-like glycosyltransferase